VKEIGELLVGVPVEHQRAAIDVKRQFQHARSERVSRALGKHSRYASKRLTNLILRARSRAGQGALYAVNVAIARSSMRLERTSTLYPRSDQLNEEALFFHG
jgi:hypothetical protein